MEPVGDCSSVEVLSVGVAGADASLCQLPMYNFDSCVVQCAEGFEGANRTYRCESGAFSPETSAVECQATTAGATTELVGRMTISVDGASDSMIELAVVNTLATLFTDDASKVSARVVNSTASPSRRRLAASFDVEFSVDVTGLDPEVVATHWTTLEDTTRPGADGNDLTFMLALELVAAGVDKDLVEQTLGVEVTEVDLKTVTPEDSSVIPPNLVAEKEGNTTGAMAAVLGVIAGLLFLAAMGILVVLKVRAHQEAKQAGAAEGPRGADEPELRAAAGEDLTGALDADGVVLEQTEGQITLVSESETVYV